MTSLLARATTNVLRTICCATMRAPSILLSSALKENALRATPTAMNPVAFGCGMTGVRFASTKQKCIRNPPPRCCPEELKKTPCHQSRTKCKDTSDPNCSPFKSMWENPACCGDPCPVFPRFDDLYYRMSDKECRVYQQTWNECPDMVIRKRPICCYEKVCMPKYEKRKRSDCPKTACGPGDGVSCRKKTDHRCPKMSMPCCGAARNPPKCNRIRKPSCCVKICCPYPSYSECCRDPTKKRRPVECGCLNVVNMCEINEYLRQRPWLSSSRRAY